MSSKQQQSKNFLFHFLSSFLSAPRRAVLAMKNFFKQELCDKLSAATFTEATHIGRRKRRGEWVYFSSGHLLSIPSISCVPLQDFVRPTGIEVLVNLTSFVGFLWFNVRYSTAELGILFNGAGEERPEKIQLGPINTTGTVLNRSTK